MKLSPLYKQNTRGATQIWEIEIEGNKYRTIAGLLDGKKTVNNWTECSGKNIGKANETTPEEQALLEAKAKHKKKMESHYFESLDDIGKSQFFKVMLAQKYDPKKIKLPEWVISQPKLDGVRLVVTKDGAVAGRSGKPLATVDHIFEDLKSFFDTSKYLDTVLDGELYADKLADNFEELISIARKQKPTSSDLEKARSVLKYHVYDCYNPNSPDQWYVGRMRDIQLGFNELNLSHCQIVNTMYLKSDNIDKTYHKYLMEGYEGQMLRIPDSPYENKRSKNLLKRKEFLDDEFVIMEVEPGKGNWAEYAKSIKFRNSDGIEFSAGIKGTQDYCKYLLENKDRMIGLEATVRYQNLTSLNIPRFPVVHFIHEQEKI